MIPACDNYCCGVCQVAISCFHHSVDVHSLEFCGKSSSFSPICLFVCLFTYLNWYRLLGLRIYTIYTSLMDYNSLLSLFHCSDHSKFGHCLPLRAGSSVLWTSPHDDLTTVHCPAQVSTFTPQRRARFLCLSPSFYCIPRTHSVWHIVGSQQIISGWMSEG